MQSRSFLNIISISADYRLSQFVERQQTTRHLNLITESKHKNLNTERSMLISVTFVVAQVHCPKQTQFSYY
jgi:hypothetical protein